MFGKNEITKPTKVYVGYLNVNSIFYTIQGEGPFAGVPALFIRLQGCNLQCSFCDTEFSSGVPYDLEELLGEVKKSSIAHQTCVSPLVVITGGEPLLQADIARLVKGLVDEGYRVQIETAGTVFPIELENRLNVRFYGSAVTIVCSPKTKHLNKRIIPYINAYKYVLQEGFICSADGLPYFSSDQDLVAKVARPVIGAEVYVMPCDAHDVEKNKKNIEAVVEVSQKFGYRLCLQLHKIVNVE